MYKTETYYSVFPWHTNHFGSLHGGIYMSWLIDTAGVLVSSLSQGNYLLASVDYLFLFKPARLGDVVRVVATAKATWRTSVEIEVRGCVRRGESEELGAMGLMSYVAVDENNRPRPVTEVIEPDEEAQQRKRKRLERKRSVSEDTQELLPGMTFGRSYVRTIYPEHGFGNGILYAGKMYTMLDEALAIVAKLYTKGNTFTAGAGSADFLVPVKIGDILEIQGAVEYTGNSSLDVGAKLYAINHFTGVKLLVSRTVFSFVAIDDQGKPRSIPKLEPSSEYERKVMEQRVKEREERLKLAKSLQQTTCQ